MLAEVIVILIGGTAITGISIGVLKTLDRMATGPKNGKDDRGQYAARLHQPVFEELEAHFGCLIPEPLKKLYADHTELDRENFRVIPDGSDSENAPLNIASYIPADIAAVKSQMPGTEPFLAFADDGCGDAYMVDPRLVDGPVLFHDHETGEFSQICNSLSEFMSWPRVEGPVD